MRKAVREELDRIETFLLQDNADSRDLAAILTALRGDDACEKGVKIAVTLPIRAHAFPKAADLFVRTRRGISVGNYRAGVCITSTFMGMPMTPEAAALPECVSGESEHFRVHAEMAIAAIKAKDTD